MAVPDKTPTNRPKVKRPKILSYKQLMAKKYAYLENLPKHIKEAFGDLTKNFIMIVYGESGNGKTSLLTQVLKVLLEYGTVLYVSLEEGHEASMQKAIGRQMSEEVASGKIRFADSSMTYSYLKVHLARKRSEQFIVIDSIQYWLFDYDDYKELKNLFPNKTFIFTSHVKGKQPEGKTANKVKYDATIKVFVKGYIAFIKSRLEGKRNFVIYEDGAKEFWGEKFKEAQTMKL